MISRPGIFLSGIDTNIGKTVVSSLLVKLFNTDYWKPIQCGDLDNSDSMVLRKLIGKDYTGTLHPERYALHLPQSAHIAAKEANVNIKLQDFELPQSDKPIVVEGAGGCLVPINEENTVIDLAKHLGLPVVLVVRFYLGAYNHTLLSIEALQKRGIEIQGLILNEGDNPEFREFISRKTHLKFLGVVPKLKSLDSQTLETIVHQWRYTSL